MRNLIVVACVGLLVCAVIYGFPEHGGNVGLSEKDMTVLTTLHNLRGVNENTPSDVLVIGDSMVRLWPRIHDAKSFPFQRTEIVRGRLFATLRERAYSIVVIWAGTAGHIKGESTSEYLEGMTDMVDAARAAGAVRVVVISPLVYGGETEQVSDAWTRLQELRPGCVYIRSACIPLAADDLSDGLHPTHDGTLIVAQAVFEALRDEHDIRVHMAHYCLNGI